MESKHIGIIAVIALVGFIVAVSGCTSSPSYSNGTNTSSPASASTSGSDGLVILSSNIVAGSYGEYDVIGQAVNNGSESMSYAEVNAKFYGADGSVLQSGIDNINDLGPGETWNYKIMFIGDGVPKSYKIAVGPSM